MLQNWKIIHENMTSQLERATSHAGIHICKTNWVSIHPGRKPQNNSYGATIDAMRAQSANSHLWPCEHTTNQCIYNHIWPNKPLVLYLEIVQFVSYTSCCWWRKNQMPLHTLLVRMSAFSFTARMILMSISCRFLGFCAAAIIQMEAQSKCKKLNNTSSSNYK